MKITRVEVEKVQQPAQVSFRWRDGLAGSDPAGIGGVLRIGTDDGLERSEEHTSELSHQCLSRMPSSA